MAKQRHKIKQTIHQQTTAAATKSKNIFTKIYDHIKKNPADALLSIIAVLAIDANVALDDIEDLNEVQAAADLDLL